MDLDDYIAVLRRLIAPCVGRRLLSVTYGTIAGECTETDIAGGIEWISGEVKIEFDGTPAIFVGWGENDGWPDHFSLAVQDRSTFKPQTLMEYAAEQAPEWSPHIGSALLSVECRGSDDTPHALVLRFPRGSVVVADGHERTMADGDDILILPFESCDPATIPLCFWSAP